MKMETIGVRVHHNTDPGSHLAGVRNSIAQNDKISNAKAALKAAHEAGIRVLRDRDFGYLLGDPRIVIEPCGNSVFVSVRPRPWAWSNVDKEFLFGVGAERYARKLLDRVHSEGQREHDRREALKAARLREREARR